MTDRNRAWRRRKTRRILVKVNATKDWLIRQFEGKAPKSRLKEVKQHSPGKLTHAQSLRQSWATAVEVRDGMAEI